MKYPSRINIPIKKMEETLSTNDHLAQLCRDNKAEEFYTVVTNYQTDGKGQRGNTWEAERGKNILFSIVIYPTALEAKNQFYLSMLTAVSIVAALEKYTDGFSIKWPNDIYWKEKKIAGILIENEVQGKYIAQSIIGIGLNVNQETFLSDAPNPVSLKQIIGTNINREELFQKIIHGIVASYRLLEEDFAKMSATLRILYQRKLFRKNGYHPYRDAEGTFMAQLEHIGSDGYLYLQDEQGKIRRYAFKEVEFLLHE